MRRVISSLIHKLCFLLQLLFGPFAGRPYVPEKHLCRSWEILGYTVWVPTASRRLLKRLIEEDRVSRRSLIRAFVNFPHGRKSLLLAPLFWERLFGATSSIAKEEAALLSELISTPKRLNIALREIADNSVDADIWVKLCSLWKTAEADERLLPVLIRGFHCNEHIIRVYAAEALGRTHDRTAYKVLATYAERELEQTVEDGGAERNELYNAVLAGLRICNRWTPRAVNITFRVLGDKRASALAETAVCCAVQFAKWIPDALPVLRNIVETALFTPEVQAQTLKRLRLLLPAAEFVELCARCVAAPSPADSRLTVFHEALKVLAEMKTEAKGAIAALTVALLNQRGTPWVISEIKKTLTALGAKPLGSDGSDGEGMAFARRTRRLSDRDILSLTVLSPALPEPALSAA